MDCRFNQYEQAPKDTIASRLVCGQVFTFCKELINELPDRIGRNQMGGIPGVQAANTGRLTDAANPPLIERRLHPFFTQKLPLCFR